MRRIGIVLVALGWMIIAVLPSGAQTPEPEFLGLIEANFLPEQVAAAGDDLVWADFGDGLTFTRLNLTSGERESWWFEEGGLPRSMRLSPDGRWLAFASGGRVALLDLSDTGSSPRTLISQPDNPVWSYAFSPDSALLAVGFSDGAVNVLTIPDGAERAALFTEGAGALVAFLPDGALIGVGEDAALTRWSGTDFTPQETTHFEGFTQPLIALSTDGNYLSLQERTGLLVAVRLADMQPLYSLNASARPAFLSDGLIWQGSADGLLIREAASGETVYTGEGQPSVSAIFPLPGGLIIGAGAEALGVWVIGEANPPNVPLIAFVPATDTLAGERVFINRGCNGCHLQFDGAGPGVPTMGRMADSRRPGMSADAYLREAIIDPDAFVTPGYPRGIHPTFYAETLSEEELDAVIDYILAQGE